MTKRIFRGIFLVSLISMLLSLIFIIGVQYQYYSESQIESLKSKAQLIIASLNDNHDHIETFADAEERITLISPDGTVVFDNKTDIATMENHSDREEVKEALAEGEGLAFRNSGTLSSKQSYYAIKLDNGNVLRISESKVTVSLTLLRLLQPMCAIILLAVLFSLILANVLSKSIVKPINTLDMEHPALPEAYREIEPLISKINNQNKKINRQIENLKQNKREFETIASNMSEGLILTDADGCILSSNNSANEFFSITDSLEGKNILELTDNKAFNELIESVKCCYHTSKLISVNKKFYEITASPVLDNFNRLCGAVILIVDVTEKENREKLRREFTANVSHELKTPLTSIYGISDMLSSGMVESEDIKSFAGDINKESGRLISLVNDIIKLSQLDEGIISENSECCDVKSIAEEIVSRLTPIAEKRNITLEIIGKSFAITAPATLVSEMLYNLCDNAIKYNKDNGSVSVILSEEKGKKSVCVKDTGIGIESKYLDRIFERFYRVDKSRSKQIGGTGLGLSIVKHIASVLGVQIGVESKIGIGTTITLSDFS